jgi:hypothetical protein
MKRLGMAVCMVLVTATLRGEVPLANLFLQADPIVLGSVGLGIPVDGDNLPRSLEPVGVGEWRKVELCRFTLNVNFVIKGSILQAGASAPLFAFASKGSCDFSYARGLHPGKQYLWLLRQEGSLIRMVIDSYQAAIPIAAVPLAWETVTTPRDWQWKLSYLLMAPGARVASPSAYVADDMTGDLVDTVGWLTWFAVIAEIQSRYRVPLSQGLCDLLLSLGVCCNCGPVANPASSRGLSGEKCQTSKQEERLFYKLGATSIDELAARFGTKDRKSIRLEVEAAACNVSSRVAQQARRLLKDLFSIEESRCPTCGS